MRNIFKYKLGVDGDIVTIKAPIIEILDIQYQAGAGVQMWAMTDSEAEEVEMNVIALGTGWPVDEFKHWFYLRTVQDNFGYVWHYYAKRIN